MLFLARSTSENAHYATKMALKFKPTMTMEIRVLQITPKQDMKHANLVMA